MTDVGTLVRDHVLDALQHALLIVALHVHHHVPVDVVQSVKVDVDQHVKIIVL